jgi:tRNA uridine 5-carboxymethylaminomethyl modification enzyme
MFTSRAEHRLLLRMSNADLRLTELVLDSPHLTKERIKSYREKQRTVKEILTQLNSTKIHPEAYIAKQLTERNLPVPKTRCTLAQHLKRPEIKLQDFITLGIINTNLSPDTHMEIECIIKYEGYIKKQERQIANLTLLENFIIPEEIDYASLKSISFEGREQLGKLRPRTLGEASRIPGVRQSDVTLLMARLKILSKSGPIGHN